MDKKSLYLPYLPQAEKLTKVIKASGNEVEGFWPTIFAAALKGAKIDELITNIGSAAAAPVAVAGGDAGTAAAAPAEEKSK